MSKTLSRLHMLRQLHKSTSLRGLAAFSPNLRDAFCKKKGLYQTLSCGGPLTQGQALKKTTKEQVFLICTIIFII